ncbi:hypothetical protein [Rhodopirellula sp. P2]|uniref:hypothetical protein n=1 Tax=Rhodopirellula sp. P2 TaxID=2127060 RepID=UPI002367B7A5|nr:hypothetical protein [Rhodopirellula sp. P2]WDQ16155.1 hypothetical protein PSR62_21365 [Rhodopirellula sp. P2]
MQRFKTRLRLLAEKLGGSLTFGHDGSLIVMLSTGRVHFQPLSRDEMRCDVTLDGDEFSLTARKTHCFDIVDRLSAPHLAPKLKRYAPNLLIELSEYIRDEQAGDRIADLKRKVIADPTIVFAELGGNRWIAEYYHGYLILSDDLCYGATNMVEL